MGRGEEVMILSQETCLFCKQATLRGYRGGRICVGIKIVSILVSAELK